MVAESVQRRLAAILAADVVGFSRLMEANEERTLGALKLHRPHGRGVRALHRLVQIMRTYPRQPFLAAVEQALKFGLFDLTRLEHLVLRHVAGDFFALGGDDGSDDDDADA